MSETKINLEAGWLSASCSVSVQTDRALRSPPPPFRLPLRQATLTQQGSAFMALLLTLQ